MIDARIKILYLIMFFGAIGSVSLFAARTERPAPIKSKLTRNIATVAPTDTSIEKVNTYVSNHDDQNNNQTIIQALMNKPNYSK